MKKIRKRATGGVYIGSPGRLGAVSRAGRRPRSTPRLEGADLREGRRLGDRSALQR
jgi:hypothetical protein